jgi:hypothetical protein
MYCFEFEFYCYFNHKNRNDLRESHKGLIWCPLLRLCDLVFILPFLKLFFPTNGNRNYTDLLIMVFLEFFLIKV